MGSSAALRNFVLVMVIDNFVNCLVQVWQEFQEVAKTTVRLMDNWQQYKARILELAATKVSTAHLLSDVDDMDEGVCLKLHCLSVGRLSVHSASCMHCCHSAAGWVPWAAGNNSSANYLGIVSLVLGIRYFWQSS